MIYIKSKYEATHTKLLWKIIRRISRQNSLVSDCNITNIKLNPYVTTGVLSKTYDTPKSYEYIIYHFIISVKRKEEMRK